MLAWCSPPRSLRRRRNRRQGGRSEDRKRARHHGAGGRAPHQAGYYQLRSGVEFGEYVEAIVKDQSAIPELSTTSSYGVIRPYTGAGEEQSQRAPNLEPGTYAVLCFVIDSETGKNHYEMGMIGRLEVVE